MFMRNRIVPALLLGCWLALAQQPATEPRSSLKVDFPKDSPVAVVGFDMGDSVTTTRGSAIVIDLRTLLTLRNAASRRLRGVTLLVSTPEGAVGGRASVSVPSLNVEPGGTFPVRINLRLLRPLAPAGPLVTVTLDGALFEDLSFFGPNLLNSRRSMLVWELEAQRDRRYFKSVLSAGGPESLRARLLETLARQDAKPRLDVQLARGRATNLEAVRTVQFAFLELAGAPVEPLAGSAMVSGGEARAPSLEVINRSRRTVRYFEVGLILRDEAGREYLAGSVPASDPDLNLAPGARTRVTQDATLRFLAAGGRPLAIAGLTGYVSQVEFADGSIWIPDRRALADPRLAEVVVPSPEEQRLADLYRRKGLQAVIDELNKF